MTWNCCQQLQTQWTYTIWPPTGKATQNVYIYTCIIALYPTCVVVAAASPQTRVAAYKALNHLEVQRISVANRGKNGIVVAAQGSQNKLYSRDSLAFYRYMITCMFDYTKCLYSNMTCMIARLLVVNVCFPPPYRDDICRIVGLNYCQNVACALCNPKPWTGGCSGRQTLRNLTSAAKVSAKPYCGFKYNSFANSSWCLGLEYY
jgi:hypothetical protein